MTSTKKLARIALTGALLFVSFISFSNILYLEAITLMVVTVSLVFDKSDSFFSCLILGFLLVMYMGLTPWTIMYLVIYPCYSLLTSMLKSILLKNSFLLIIFGFILSASTGMILDLPFILINKNVTIYYIITGLKTSLIQGCLTAGQFTLIFEPLYQTLCKVKEK